MKKKALHRRTFLKGAGGALISLPLLDIMLSTNGDCLAATGQPVPGRFVVMFGGGALSTNGGNLDAVVPKTTGANWESTTALAPIIAAGLKGDVSIVSGLKCPISTQRGIGAAAVTDPASGYHENCWLPQLNGATSISGRSTRYQGATIDQVIAGRVGSQTRIPYLLYHAQTKTYLGDSDFNTRNAISLRATGGGFDKTPAQTSPQAAFRSLFAGGVTPGTLPTADPNISRRSVLDQVLLDARRLWSALGTADRQKLDQHLEAIRNLETRLSQTAPPVSGASCRQPASFPADPGGRPGEIEAERTKLYNELTRLAFACDLTRTASIMVSCAQSRLIVPGLGEVHESTHGAGDPGTVARIVAWHIQNGYCDLLKKLKSTSEGNGNLLDYSTAVYVTEAGFGTSNELSDQKGKSPHSTENMMTLIAGKVGGLRPGRHIAYQNQQHPAKVMTSAMRALGLGERLNEIQGTLPELF